MIFENAWPILKTLKLNNMRQFKERYDLYFRHTQFCSEEHWLKADLQWIIHRDYDNNGQRNNPMWEACIYVTKGNKIPWFIWEDEFGQHKLIVVEKQNYLGEGI